MALLKALIRDSHQELRNIIDIQAIQLRHERAGRIKAEKALARSLADLDFLRRQVEKTIALYDRMETAENQAASLETREMVDK